MFDLFEFPQPTSKYMRASRGELKAVRDVLFRDVFVDIANATLRAQVLRSQESLSLSASKTL